MNDTTMTTTTTTNTNNNNDHHNNTYNKNVNLRGQDARAEADVPRGLELVACQH